MPTIWDFLIDDHNVEKFASHGISPRQVLQVLTNPHIVVPNRRERAAKYLIIGQDDGGACLAIPVIPTHDPILWRPVTAWYCKDREEKALEERRS